nr:MAG TPA: hypothetical protein [Caudoviricetes sp.]
MNVIRLDRNVKVEKNAEELRKIRNKEEVWGR